jgi:hypothetical protein
MSFYFTDFKVAFVVFPTITIVKIGHLSIEFSWLFYSFVIDFVKGKRK